MEVNFCSHALGHKGLTIEGHVSHGLGCYEKEPKREFQVVCTVFSSTVTRDFGTHTLPVFVLVATDGNQRILFILCFVVWQCTVTFLVGGLCPRVCIQRSTLAPDSLKAVYR